MEQWTKKIAGNTCYNGIWYIEDLFDENGKIIVVFFFKWQRIGFTNYLLWRSVISTIPQWLKAQCIESRHLSKQPDTFIIFRNRQMYVSKLSTKMITMVLKENIYQNSTSETYWRSKYEINEEDFGFIYELPLIIIPDTRTRFFLI